jgi:hypothetical protein
MMMQATKKLKPSTGFIANTKNKALIPAVRHVKAAAPSSNMDECDSNNLWSGRPILTPETLREGRPRSNVGAYDPSISVTTPGMQMFPKIALMGPNFAFDTDNIHHSANNPTAGTHEQLMILLPLCRRKTT